MPRNKQKIIEQYSFSGREKQSQLPRQSCHFFINIVALLSNVNAISILFLIIWAQYRLETFVLIYLNALLSLCIPGELTPCFLCSFRLGLF